MAATLFSVISGQRARHLSPQARHTWSWYQLQLRQLEKEAGFLLESVQQQDSDPEIQQQFLETRRVYKRLELLLEYFQPAAAAMLNDPQRSSGLGALETKLFPFIREKDTGGIRAVSEKMLSGIRALRAEADSLSVGDAQLFDAMRQEIVRILAFGISGADSPLAQESMLETRSALNGIKAVWLFYQEKLEKRNPELVEHTLELFAGARRMLDTATGFDTFSRAEFINDYLNPLSVRIKLAREALKIPYADSVAFLDPAASHVFARGAFPFSAEEEAATRMESRFDRFMRGNGEQLDRKEIRGFNLFMGKAKCGTCHIAPLFNGQDPLSGNDTHNATAVILRNYRDTISGMHYSRQLTSGEQQDVIAFVRSLHDVEI
ncbi:hypothetical protein [Chitinophaga sp. XS-30]|uniref:hypothetical protein n=1 Tax=Chitinophaga sp. XS-30 TaxID=2604421 RepID=UPI0011DD1551|nr:hypothetical protein [Chitinophaga sp. XS-30]QEH40143.1 hypothetical protein FW415_04375 [Chitinophaga sp. XS-30]